LNGVTLRSVFAPPLNGVELVANGGLFIVLGTESDGTALLIRLLAGMEAPQRGQVRIADQDPARSPELRRRIGCVSSVEELAPAASVSAALSLALRARADDATPEHVLRLLALEGWARREPDSLTRAERRSLALALALSVRSPLLLAVHEPLSGLAGVEPRKAIELISERAHGGATVVCTTASARDAAELAGSLLLLDRGRIVRRPKSTEPSELAPGFVPELRIRSRQARLLAAELATEASVDAVEWDEQRTPGELRARGQDVDALGLAVLRSARRAGADIDSLVPTLPTLERMRAATDGLSRAAYEEAQRTAYEAAQRAFRAAAGGSA
jgi:ABC-2 type transport system ATP-binding protein